MSTMETFPTPVIGLFSDEGIIEDAVFNGLGFISVDGATNDRQIFYTCTSNGRDFSGGGLG